MTFGKWGLLGFGALVAIALGATWALRHRDDGIPAIEFSPADLQKGGRVLPGEHDAMVAACQREFQARLADKTAAVCACLATQSEQRLARPWRLRLAAKFENDETRFKAVGKGLKAAGMSQQDETTAEGAALQDIANILMTCRKTD